jgi:hypothetical protein
MNPRAALIPILAAALCTWTVSPTAPQDLWETDLDKATELARETGRPLLALFR